MGPADCCGGDDGQSCPSSHLCCWLIFHEQHGSVYRDCARAVHVYARVHPAPAPAPVIIGDDDGGGDGGGAVVGEIDSAVAVVVDDTAGAAGARDTALSSSLDLQIQ